MLTPPTQFSMASLVEDTLPHLLAQGVLLGYGQQELSQPWQGDMRMA